MAASSKILDLRALLAERYPQPPPTAAAHIPTGLAPLDEALGGGLAKGAITELTSPHPSAGSALVISALLHLAHQQRHFLALIDGRDSFDPQPLGNARLRHLLWLRCTKALDAVKAADLLLRDGNFPIVALDLVLNSADELRKIPQTSWYRLQRLAEAVPSAFLILTRRSMISSAQSKLVLQNAWSLPDLQRDASVERLAFDIKRTHAGLQQRAETG
ncbi:MAG: hypothetical protein ABR526_05950 [Chthoniobacterales bacterium]